MQCHLVSYNMQYHGIVHHFFPKARAWVRHQRRNAPESLVAAAAVARVQHQSKQQTSTLLEAQSRLGHKLLEIRVRYIFLYKCTTKRV